MDFLPLEVDGKKVYAGFWKRFAAIVFDNYFFKLIFFLFLLGSYNLMTGFLFIVPASLIFPLYSIFFHKKYGGTLGKLAVGIRVTNPDGTNIDWYSAVIRSLVDLFFSSIIAIGWIATLLTLEVKDDVFASASMFQRMDILKETGPAWKNVVELFSSIWIASEAFVMLFNKKRRAIHDFMAETVVIESEFVQYNIEED